VQQPGSISSRRVLHNPPSLSENAPIITENPLADDFLNRSVFAHISEISIRTYRNGRSAFVIESDNESALRVYGIDADDSLREIRRLVHYMRWRRKDPVTRLPPGAANKISHSITTGLSLERSRTLAKSLGFSYGHNTVAVQGELNSQMQQTFELRVEISAQEQRTAELTLSNPSDSGYRLFAMWHVDHLIKVDALFAPLRRGDSVNSDSVWVSRGYTEFVTENEPHITYAEVGKS
jgi:hypothetical protein